MVETAVPDAEYRKQGRLHPAPSGGAASSLGRVSREWCVAIAAGKRAASAAGGAEVTPSGRDLVNAAGRESRVRLYRSAAEDIASGLGVAVEHLHGFN